jgi:hypothetical protein
MGAARAMSRSSVTATTLRDGPNTTASGSRGRSPRDSPGISPPGGRYVAGIFHAIHHRVGAGQRGEACQRSEGRINHRPLLGAGALLLGAQMGRGCGEGRRECDLPAGSFTLLGDVGARRFGGQGGSPLGHYPCQFGMDRSHLCRSFLRASFRKEDELCPFLAWMASLQAATAAFLSLNSLAFFSFAALFLALCMVLVVATRETPPIQMGHEPGGGKMGKG